jgi:hypothetical protein
MKNKILFVLFFLISVFSLFSCAHEHKFGEWGLITEAKCEEAGSKVRTCKCGEVETQKIEPLGHSIDSSRFVFVSCEESYIENTCGRCYSVIIEQQPPREHNFNSWYIQTPATCETNGKEARMCSTCMKYEYRDIEAKGHSTITLNAVAPTCTEQGYTEGKMCGVCNKTIVSQQVIVARGHNYETDVVEPTYHNKGYTNHVCINCGDSYKTNEVDKLKCKIIWKNWDGTTLKSDNVAYGTKPSYTGSTPTKPATVEYKYEFDGWDKTIANATGDVTYTAKFKSIKNKYTVTWKNWDGTTLKTDSVEYGTKPSYTGSTPTKPATSECQYEFKGWDKTVTTVIGDVTYTAEFESVIFNYTVTWKNWDGTILEVDENVVPGTVPTYNGDAPTKDQDANTLYKWEGEWSSPLAPVYSDMTFTAVFKATEVTKIDMSNWRNYFEVNLYLTYQRSEYDSQYYSHVIASGQATNINSNYEYIDVKVTVRVTIQFYERVDGEKYYRESTKEYTFTINEVGNGTYSFEIWDVYGMAHGINSSSKALVDISGYAVEK